MDQVKELEEEEEGLHEERQQYQKADLNSSWRRGSV